MGERKKAWRVAGDRVHTMVRMATEWLSGNCSAGKPHKDSD